MPPPSHQAKHGNLRLDKTFNFCYTKPCYSRSPFCCFLKPPSQSHLISLRTADLCTFVVGFWFHASLSLKGRILTTRQSSEKNCHRFQTKQRHQMGRLPSLNRQMILLLVLGYWLVVCISILWRQPLFVCHNSVKDYLDGGRCPSLPAAKEC